MFHSTLALAKRKTCGTIPLSTPNKSSDIFLGKTNCNVLNSEPPHDADSIIKPLVHLNTNSARRVHQGTVISSDISWRNKAGMEMHVTSWRLAVFKMFLRPGIWKIWLKWTIYSLWTNYLELLDAVSWSLRGYSMLHRILNGIWYESVKDLNDVS